MLTLIHILKHPEFGSHIQTLAFNAILPAMNSAIFNWDNAPWGNQDERWLESDTSPQLSQSGTPEFVDISPPPGSPHPPAIFQLPESAFLITSGTNFGMYMFHVTELFEKLQRPIDIEINDHALDDKIKPPAFIMKVGWNTMGFLQMMKVPVGKLSVDLTSHAQGIGLLGLLHLACFFHDILAGNPGLNLKKELALRLAFGRNGAIENSSDYDPKAGILHLYGINIWHRDLDRNPTPWAAWITEAMFMDSDPVVSDLAPSGALSCRSRRLDRRLTSLASAETMHHPDRRLHRAITFAELMQREYFLQHGHPSTHIQRRSDPRRKVNVLDFPLEILERMISFVDANDLVALRLTCKKLEKAAMTNFIDHFFKCRRHVVSAYSLEALLQITSHPYLGQFVEVVMLDTDCVVEEVGQKCIEGGDEPLDWDKLRNLIHQIISQLKKHGNAITLGVTDYHAIRYAAKITRLTLTNCRCRDDLDYLRFRQLIKACLGTLQSIRMSVMLLRNEAKWSPVLRELGPAPHLKKFELAILEREIWSPNAVVSQCATILQVRKWHCSGNEIFTELEDLAAAVEADESAWDSLEDDNPEKWAYYPTEGRNKTSKGIDDKRTMDSESTTSVDDVDETILALLPLL
ncbi:hypothetical protein KCU83_g9299, partial [Aureobasidium melanogenum]